MHRSAIPFALALAACTPMGPPVTPIIDTGPRRDAGVDAPVDAPEPFDAPTDVPMDVPNDVPLDVPMDVPFDVPNDVPLDVRIDAPICDMRADCDSNGSCETALGTITNCLSCGMACTTRPNAAATCDLATGCGFRCSTGFEDCNTTAGDGCEINTNTNLMNCGDCGNVCPFGGANTVRSCMGGDCVPFMCTTGFGDCDGDVLTGTTGTGCEINTNTSLTNCGICGRVCAGATNAGPTCVTGTCGITCNAGFLNCDSNQANGCEIDGRTDLTSCGVCGRICTIGSGVMNAVPACAASACTFACMPGFSNCDSNPANGCERTGSTCT